MQFDETERIPNQNDMIQSTIKAPKDLVVKIVMGQLMICIVILVCALVLRLVGGSFYETVRHQYIQRFANTTDLSQITQPQDESPQTQTDMVVHTSATIQPTPTDFVSNTGDSIDDSLALKTEDVMLMNVSNRGGSLENAMISPLNGTITSAFGYRIHPVYGTRLFHNGVDIAAAQGTPIQGALSGTVMVAEYHSSYGNYVILDHGNDFCTVYAHCSRLFVSVGQTIRQGDEIAAVGSTGVSTGPHLHFEVRRGEERVDPQLLVELG